MYFDTFAEFLQMGKHGLYVWSAYGATGLVLLWSWISARSMLSGIERQLAEQAEISARGAKQARTVREQPRADVPSPPTNR